jgi:hypothetical protein
MGTTPDPDFLCAALDAAACAVPADRDRMNFANANELYRKSGLPAWRKGIDVLV